MSKRKKTKPQKIVLPKRNPLVTAVMKKGVKLHKNKKKAQYKQHEQICKLDEDLG